MTKKIFFWSFLITLLIIVIAINIFVNYHIEFNWFLAKKFRIPNILQIIIAVTLISGATYLLQILTKNDRADVSTIGINGFNLLITSILMTFIHQDLYTILKKDWWIIIIIISSIFIAICIYFLSWILKKQKNSIIISGIVLTLTCAAFSYLFIDRLVINKQELLSELSIGGLQVKEYDNQLWVALGIGIFSLIWYCLIAKKIFIVTTNEQKARSLGINVNFYKLQAILLIGIMSAGSYIIMGNLFFIGFVSSNIAFMIFKKKAFSTFFAAIIIGIIISLFSYWIWKSVFNYNISEGIYIAINSACIMILSIIFKKGISLWKKSN